MDILAVRMKELRKAFSFSQEAAAKELNIAIPTYCRYEYGQREPNATTIAAMARLYHVSADYLLGISDDPAWRGPSDEP